VKRWVIRVPFRPVRFRTARFADFADAFDFRVGGVLLFLGFLLCFRLWSAAPWQAVGTFKICFIVRQSEGDAQRFPPLPPAFFVSAGLAMSFVSTYIFM
jgi:hypothetical protein